MNDLAFSVPCLFGLEGIVKKELIRLGLDSVKALNGSVEFAGELADVAKANLWLRSGERVLIKLGEFRAETFDDLFEGVKALPLERFIGKSDAFPVKGYSLKSKLFSIPDCQAIVKKAAVSRLSGKYGITWFEETGAKKQLQFSIMNDIATIFLDTTGTGLHKRGYRAISNEAPLRETLAAALVSLSHFRAGDNMYDPFCGSGTIAIEAALEAANIAPGLKRTFSAEKFPEISRDVWTKARKEALASVRNASNHVYASDIDPKSVALTIENAKKFGVEKYISAFTADVKEFCLKDSGSSVIICNPPYGERLMELKEAELLYRAIGQKFIPLSDTRYSILTSHEDFERHFGKTAKKKRKLYNGMIKCWLFQYFD